MATNKTNAGKVKITHNVTGKSFFKTPDAAEKILAKFKGAYSPEQLAADPSELSDEGKKAVKTQTPGAAADQQADETN